MKNTVTHDADPLEYFALNEGKTKGDKDWVVSRSDLLPFLNATPRHWIEATDIPNTRSIRLGSLVDCLVLTPDRFGEWYAIQPETYTAPGPKGKPPVEKKWSNNATVCKEWNSLNSAGGKIVVSRKEVDEARGMADAILGKRVISWGGTVGEFIGLSSCQTMVVTEYVEPTTGMVVPLRALIDVCPPDSVSPDSLWDLKTTRDASPEGWQKSVAGFDYDFQGYFYLTAYTLATTTARTKFGHLCVANSAPHLAAVYQLSNESLELGRKKFECAIRQYCQCVLDGEFPGYDDDINVVEPQGWELKKWNV